MNADARALRPRPPGGDHVSLGTVCGFPLESGERVLAFVAPDHRRTKMLYIVVGALLSVVGVGIALIVYGLLYDRWATTFVAITSTRVLVKRGGVHARSPVHAVRLSDVMEMRARPIDGEGRRRITPNNAGAEVTALVHNRSGAEKTEPRYWSNATALVVRGRASSLTIDRSADLEKLGPVLAHALYTDGFVERAPTVETPA